MLAQILLRFAKNRMALTPTELKGMDDEFGYSKSFNGAMLKYWVRAEPVVSVRCTCNHVQGRPLYFGPFGMLIKHKCPHFICPHAMAQLSPMIYVLYDQAALGKGVDSFMGKYTYCTDLGRERGGLGNVVFKLSMEEIPTYDRIRILLSMLPHLLWRNRRATRSYAALENAPKSGGPKPIEFMKKLPLKDDELERFLAAPERVKRLQAIEKFKNHRIVMRITESNSCIAGHKVGDEFEFDSMGRLIPPKDGTRICLMALNKIYYRGIVALERMGLNVDEDVDVNTMWAKFPISCSGGFYPLSSCGQIWANMEIFPRKENA